MLYREILAVCCEIHTEFHVEFFALSQNSEMRLLASLCLSVRPPSLNNSAQTGMILIKYDIWGFIENLLRKFKFH